jgi:hypothetical protein
MGYGLGHSEVSASEGMGYAGVFFDLTGAVVSLFASGLINVGAMAYPILMIGVAVASWACALRPAVSVPVE